MDWLNTIFLGCFIFGLVFTVASFMLGGLGHIGGLDGVGHAGGGHIGQGADLGGHNLASADGHGQASVQVGGIGWLNFNALIVFITWFGGAGFVLISLGTPGWLAVGLALIGGVIGYFALLLFLSKVLYASQTPLMRDQDYNLSGTVARVSSPIFESGIGEVIYTRFGTRRSTPARSVDGQPFPKEAQVVILRYEDGVAYVEDLDKLLSDAGAEKWSTNSLLNKNGKRTS